jgi:hypothetical protein
MKTVFKFTLSLLLLVWLCHPGIVSAGNAGPVENELRLDRAAGLNNASLDRILEAARRGQIDGENTIRWLAQVRKAAREKLPTEPLIDKIEEGVAKRINARRIEGALVRVTENLRFVKSLTSGDARQAQDGTPAERQRMMARMSELLSAGVAQDEMRQLYETWKQAPLQQKFQALTFYVVTKQAGLDPAEARQIAAAGIEQNHFHGFPLDLAMMIKSAKSSQIESSKIVRHALRVIRGAETVAQAQRQLGIRQMDANPIQGNSDLRGKTGSGGGLQRNGGLSGSGATGGSHGHSGGGHGAGGGRGR